MANNNIYRPVAYGLTDALLNVFPAPIVAQRDPTAADKAQIGSVWVNKPSNSAFVLTSVVSNAASWIDIGGGSGTFSSLTVTPGNITATLGNINATAGSMSAGTSISAGTTLTAGTGITATTGNIAASSGNVTASGSMSAGTTVTAGTGITATTGNIVASTGNITATLGNIAASAGSVSASTTVTAGTSMSAGTSISASTTVTAGTSLIATAGNITATAGNIVATAGNISATVGTIIAGGIVEGSSVVASGDAGGLASTTTMSNATNTTQGAGTLSIKSTTGNNGNNTGFLKFYVGATAVFVPYFVTINP